MAKDINIEHGLDESSDENETGDSETEDCEEKKADKESTRITEEVKNINLKKTDEEKAEDVNNGQTEKRYEDKTEDANYDKVGNPKLSDRIQISDGDSESGSDYSDRFISGSVRSSTTTIHPDEIKKRVRKQMHTKERRMERRKCVAKGEASAVTRNRRENADTIRHSTGIWGWE